MDISRVVRAHGDSRALIWEFSTFTLGKGVIRANAQTKRATCTTGTWYASQVCVDGWVAKETDLHFASRSQVSVCVTCHSFCFT